MLRLELLEGVLGGGYLLFQLGLLVGLLLYLDALGGQLSISVRSLVISALFCE